MVESLLLRFHKSCQKIRNKNTFLHVQCRCQIVFRPQTSPSVSTSRFVALVQNSILAKSFDLPVLSALSRQTTDNRQQTSVLLSSASTDDPCSSRHGNLSKIDSSNPWNEFRCSKSAHSFPNARGNIQIRNLCVRRTWPKPSAGNTVLIRPLHPEEGARRISLGN